MTVDPDDKLICDLKTSFGRFQIALDPSISPKSVNVFAFLASNGFYDGMKFHRYEPGFVLQGGCPNGDGSGNAGFSYFGDPVTGSRPYTFGTVAMASNHDLSTCGSQFFIALGGFDEIAAEFPVIGQITTGIEKLRALDTTVGSWPEQKTAEGFTYRDARPKRSATIDKATIRRSGRS